MSNGRMSRSGGAFLVGLLLFSLGGGVFAWAQEGPSEQDLPVTITSDRMEGDFKAGVVTFLDQVKVVRGEMILYADKVVTYPKDGGEDLERVIATGHVKVISGNRTSVADRAEYLEEGEILLLTGNAKVTDENNTLTGPLIRVYLNEDRTEVEGNTVERPKFLFYPEKGKDKAGRSGE